MPGRAIIGGNTATANAFLSNVNKINNANSTPVYNASGCYVIDECINQTPGAWIPPWNLEGSLSWTISLSDADPNDGFFTEGQIYDGDSNPNNGVRYETYLTNPNAYDFSSSAVVTYGWPITGNSCDEQFTVLQQTYPKLNIVSFEVDTYLNGSLLVSGCPDSYYNLYGESQNSPTSGIIDVNGIAVQSSWGSVL